MSEESWTWNSDVSFPSESGAGKRVLDDVLTQLEAHGFSMKDTFGVHMAIEEALVNAIKHGNRLDASKRVHVNCKVSPRRLWIRIQDEGEGFNPVEVPDPTSPENLELPCGRGLMLMRSFMSSVEYNKAGNCVVMEKERSDD